jgi:hypothetical protein
MKMCFRVTVTGFQASKNSTDDDVFPSHGYWLLMPTQGKHLHFTSLVRK